jgi:hypothetical protein
MTATPSIWCRCQLNENGFWYYPYGSKNSEEGRWHLDAKGDCADRVHSNWKSESPPTHVEVKGSTHVDARKGEYQPDKSKTPHDQRHEKPDCVQNVTGDIWHYMSLREVCTCSYPEIQDAGQKRQ